MNTNIRNPFARVALPVAILVAVGLVLPQVATADKKADAKDKFKEGIADYKDENYEEALESFLASDELYHHPDTLVNIANCYAELYEFPSAMMYFEQYLIEKGDDITDEKQKEIENKMDRVGKKVGKLVIEPDDLEGDLIIDGESRGSLPLDKPMYLEAGLHQVSVKQDSSVVYSKQINIISGSKTAIEIDPDDVEDEDAEVEEDDGEDADEETADKPKKKKKKKKKKKGALRVELAGDETATVLVDGEEVGEAPWEDQYKEGVYEVEVESEDKPGWKGEVEVQSAKHTVVTVDLNATKKTPNPNNPLFWSMIGATVPSLVTGIIVSVFAKKNNDEANKLFNELHAGVYDTDTDLKSKMTQRQNDLVDLGENEKKGAMALYISSGVFAALAIASIFIFQKEKPAASGSFEISGISPMLVPGSGALGASLAATF